MGKETQTVEVFVCPNCGAKNYIEWVPSETSRKIACSSDYVERRIPQTMKDDQGNDIIVEQITNDGFHFDCTRGAGDEFQERLLDHDLGRETSWQVTARGVPDPGLDVVLHSEGAVL